MQNQTRPIAYDLNEFLCVSLSPASWDEVAAKLTRNGFGYLVQGEQIHLANGIRLYRERFETRHLGCASSE